MPRKRRKKHPVKRRDDLLDHPRLKGTANAIRDYREELLDEQDFTCPLCGIRITSDKAVLDHSHATGHVRAVLHRGCNALLGKCENNYKRMGISIEQLTSISPAIGAFLVADYSHMPFHPTHRTSEEKRLSRNERARKKPRNPS